MNEYYVYEKGSTRGALHEASKPIDALWSYAHNNGFNSVQGLKAVDCNDPISLVDKYTKILNFIEKCANQLYENDVAPEVIASNIKWAINDI